MTESAAAINPLANLEGKIFDAVIFDMDGTLIDSTPVVERSWAQWAREYNLSDDDLAHAHGIPARTTAERLFPADMVDEAFNRIEQIELEDVDGITPLPGAADAISALPAGRRAIATSCTRQLMEVRLMASGIPRPEVLVSVDDVERGKPNPDPFLRAAELLGLDPTRCLAIEDAPGGLKAARTAGCTTIGVTTTSSADVLAPLADAVVADLSAIRLVSGPEGVTVELA